MTREEAIKILKAGSTFAYDEKEAGDFCEAYDMAVKALEAQDVDAISRQAVLWMLTNIKYTHCGTAGQADVIDTAKTMVNAMPSAQASYRQVAGKLDITDCISRQMAIDAMTEAIWHYPNEFYQRLNDYEIAKELAEFGLLSLPSAQPTQPNTPNTLKSLDCIDRRDAIRIVDSIDTWQAGWRGDAIESLKALPSAQPDVVHCRECVHADKHFHCSYMNTWNHPDGYCYCGKRKGKR